MNGAKPSFRPRPSGGFNAGMGSFNEHMDESAMGQAMQNKALSQQGSTPSQQQVQQALQRSGPQSPHSHPGGRITSLTDELVHKPAKDFTDAFTSFFDIYNWLGMEKPQFETPEEQGRKKQIHQKFTQLTQEDQQFVQQKYRQELQRREMEEQQKQERQRQEQMRSASAPVMPSSGKQKGPVGPATSRKQKAVQKLQDDRQKLGGPGGSH